MNVRLPWLDRQFPDADPATMPFLHHRPGLALFACLALFLPQLVSLGCATAPRYGFDRVHAAALPMPDLAEARPRALPMYAGGTGEAIRWEGLMAAAEWAEIIVIGEQHDDAVGHAVETAVVRDVLERWPGSGVSMEMLERDEQPIVDDYLEGIIDRPTFVRLTHSASWARGGSWDEWFQPVVDAAKETGSRVIAANAPRRYVRLARQEGYGRLRALPRDRRAFVHIPPRLAESDYRERFTELMRTMSEGSQDDDDAAAAHQLDPSHVDAVFRSQMLWDATMAHSIIRANPSRSRKIVHLVGQFHSDFEGGTILELRRHRPWARILTISLQRRDGTAFHEDDRGRADIVIYTGELPEEDDDAEKDGEGVGEGEDGDEAHDVHDIHDLPCRPAEDNADTDAEGGASHTRSASRTKPDAAGTCYSRAAARSRRLRMAAHRSS